MEISLLVLYRAGAICIKLVVSLDQEGTEVV